MFVAANVRINQSYCKEIILLERETKRARMRDKERERERERERETDRQIDIE